SRRRHTRSKRDWSSDVCSSDLIFAFERLFYTTVKEESDVSIFFGFGNTQLSFVVFRHPLAEGVNQRSWRVSNRSFDVSGVFGQRSEERRVGKERKARRARYPCN